MPSRRSAAIVIAALACGLASGGALMAFELRSAAFAAGATIPKQHTCDGADRSPPLDWSDPPAGTQAFALLCDDPDAPVGDWVHWVVIDLPAGARSLPEGVATGGAGPGGSVQGLNDFRRLGYGGPCPPRGPAHRYYFKLYALDQKLALKPGATKAQLLAAIQGRVLAHAELIGRYARQ
jgi:hypothetical protein